MVVPLTDAASATPFSDADANAILPGIIDYAEQRMYRDLDLIETVTSSTGTLTPNSRAVSIPTGFVVLNDFNVITPAGAAPDDANAVRNPVRRASRDFIDSFFPQGASPIGTPSIPLFFANNTNSRLYLGPAPDAAYVGEFVGTQRPPSLSSTNTSTILTTYLPDIFLIAAMVFASGYQKNWTATGDDTRMSITWESQYQELIKSAFVEEARKKAQSAGWTSYSPTPAATPPRQ